MPETLSPEPEPENLNPRPRAGEFIWILVRVFSAQSRTSSRRTNPVTCQCVCLSAPCSPPQSQSACLDRKPKPGSSNPKLNPKPFTPNPKLPTQIQTTPFQIDLRRDDTRATPIFLSDSDPSKKHGVLSSGVGDKGFGLGFIDSELTLASES